METAITNVATGRRYRTKMKITNRGWMGTVDAIGIKSKRLSVPEMTAAIKWAGKPVIGFFVSQQIYDALCVRSPHMIEGGMCPGGIPILADPAMSSTEFEAAFDQEMWQSRCREIAAATAAK